MKTSRYSGATRALMTIAAGAAMFAATGVHAHNHFDADRAAFVDSTSVVEFNRYQIETGISADRDLSNGVRIENYSTPTTLRVGVAKNLEARFGTTGFQSNHSFANGVGSTVDGFGDSSLGLKWRAAAQRGNLPSLAFIGQLDLNSGADRLSRDGVRPSLRVATEWALPRNVTLGLVAGLASEKNFGGDRYTSSALGILVGKQWNNKVSSFVEVAAPHVAKTADGGSKVSLNIGGAYLLTKNSQLDAAIKRGLNDNTPDYSYTIGYSVKM